MGIVKFVIISLVCHSVLIGGLWAYNKYYIKPLRERQKKERKQQEAKKKAEQEKKKKMVAEGTAKIVSPEKAGKKAAGSKPRKPVDMTKPTGRPEDYKGFKKPPAKKGGPVIPDDEFKIE